MASLITSQPTMFTSSVASNVTITGIGTAFTSGSTFTFSGGSATLVTAVNGSTAIVAITASTAGTQTLTCTDSSGGTCSVTVRAPIFVPANNSNFLYSHQSWQQVGGGSPVGITGCADAYVKILANNGPFRLRFDTSHYGSATPPRILVRLDSWAGGGLTYYGPAVDGIYLPVATDAFIYHNIEIFQTNPTTAWDPTASNSDFLRFLGIEQAGSTIDVYPYQANAKKVVISSDSWGAGGTGDGDNQGYPRNAHTSYLSNAMQQLGVEWGNSSYAGQGMAKAAGAVPQAATSIFNINAGVTRDFSATDLVIFQQGNNYNTSDTAASLIALMVPMINTLHAANSNLKVVFLQAYTTPPNSGPPTPGQRYYDGFAGAVAGCNNPSRAFFFNNVGANIPAGFLNSSHPYGSAPAFNGQTIVEQIRSVLWPASGGNNGVHS